MINIENKEASDQFLVVYYKLIALANLLLERSNLSLSRISALKNPSLQELTKAAKALERIIRTFMDDGFDATNKTINANQIVVYIEQFVQAVIKEDEEALQRVKNDLITLTKSV